MGTTRQLGRLVKRKYPVYAPYSDEEVGWVVKHKYPNAYGDFTEQIYEERKLLDHYDPSIGRLTSWWRRIKSESRGNLSTQISSELRSVLERGAMLEDSALSSEKKWAEYEAFLLTSQLEFRELQAKLDIIEAAAQRGESLETSQTKKLASHESALSIDQKIVDSKLRVEEQSAATTDQIKLAESLSHIKLHEFEEIEAIKFNQELDRMREQVRLALIAKALSSHQRVILVQELLDGLYKQIEEVEQTRLTEGTKLRMIEDREEIISHFKGYRNAEGNRLLQTD
jgi:hypothetical protein